MVRTPAEDAKFGKQVLVLLAPRAETLAAEFEKHKKERFEREGNPLLLRQAEPTAAEALQIVDRLLRQPKRLGGAELSYPPPARLPMHRPDEQRAGFPPPSWRVGGVELIEACFPVHDTETNAELERLFRRSWFLTHEAEAQRSNRG